MCMYVMYTMYAKGSAKFDWHKIQAGFSRILTGELCDLILMETGEAYGHGPPLSTLQSLLLSEHNGVTEVSCSDHWCL